MNKKVIYLLGVGHATPLFIELAEACGYSVAGLYHYNEERNGEMDHGHRILGSFAQLFNSEVKNISFCMTMGDMNIKQTVSQIITDKGGVIPSLIHPTAVISRFADISNNGVLICSHCEVHNDAVIDEGCVLWPQVIIGHDTTLHEYVFLGPKAYVGAYTEVHKHAFIGQCSVLISGKVKEVGSDCLIGAGAVVTGPVPEKSVMAGNPARILKYKE